MLTRGMKEGFGSLGVKEDPRKAGGTWVRHVATLRETLRRRGVLVVVPGQAVTPESGRTKRMKSTTLDAKGLVRRELSPGIGGIAGLPRSCAVTGGLSSRSQTAGEGISVDILITTKTQKTPGPTVTVNCPLCNATSVSAESFEQMDHLSLFYVIPLFRLRNTFVRCSACGKQLTANITIDEIADYSADELSYYLAGRVFLISRFLAVASVLLCWVPIVGLVLGICAVVANLRTVGCLRTLSWIGAVLSALVTIALVAILATG